MVGSIEEFNYLLTRLKEKETLNKLGKSLQIKLQAFKEVETLINGLNNPETNKHAVSGSFFMGTTKLNKLKKQYEFVCNDYIDAFIKKQSMSFNGWVGDEIGGVACCNDFYFNFQDIVWDVNSKQPKGAIVDWYYENLEIPEKSINYFSYTKGLRVSE